MISTSRSKALADTLDWLDERCRSGTVRARVQVHSGAMHEGTLLSVSRRELRVMPNDARSPVTLTAADIARIWVAEGRLSGLRRPDWALWFDYDFRTRKDGTGMDAP